MYKNVKKKIKKGIDFTTSLSQMHNTSIPVPASRPNGTASSGTTTATTTSQLSRAISRENYEDAAKLKVAMPAATTTDAVSVVMSHLNKAIEEERYEDAAFIRDYASAGLL